MWTRAKLGGGGLMRTFPNNWAKKQGSWPLDASFPTKTAETYDTSGAPACHFMGRRPGLFSRS
jgi:hypothetical protein